MYLHVDINYIIFGCRLYRCPQCQTSLTDMTHAWNDMDREIGVWEMPQHLRDFKVKVIIIWAAF